MSTRVDRFARGLPLKVVQSVRTASAGKVTGRLTGLAADFVDPEEARSKAAAIKAHVIANLKDYLLELEGACQQNGIHVHWAKDAASANEQILAICRKAAPNGGKVVKAKSMATEEIHLNHALEERGFEPIETDLGEYVVQLDGDMPSHIVTPIIHKDRKQIARTFARHGLGDYTEVPEELAMQARRQLRDDFASAPIGISGVNFAVSETGRIVLVENEGNNRFSTTAPRVHIAVMGIEKIIPREEHLALFLPLLAASATGQKITTYCHFIAGPRKSDELDGPEEVHLILLDNGRSKVAQGDYREILHCIRCGACLNVCPVYRQASGHAYGHVYSGPLGAVLAPALEGVETMGDLSKASTLCGACEEVCPVKIPIPRLLLQLRDESVRKGAVKDPIPWGAFAAGATQPWAWKTGLSLMPMAFPLAKSSQAGYGEAHELPKPDGVSFRKWWRGRS